MNRSKCNCWACMEYRNREPFCEWCDEDEDFCCYKCAGYRGAYKKLELLCEGCDEVFCLRCFDERDFPYNGKRYVIQALESKEAAEALRPPNRG